MHYSVDDITPECLDGFDDIIDVRSPGEYDTDHIPGAINLPVLSNDERAHVGTLYKQESAFVARRIGAAIVARNIATHLENVLTDKPKNWRPLVYCWRGGMRSNSFATILSSVGWRVGVLDEGWRRWRRAVVDALYHGRETAPRFLLIDGHTGVAKTKILEKLKRDGAAILNLEAAARHRGSVFGAITGVKQPTQKSFESTLFDELRRAPAGATVIAEAESVLIGRCRIPAGLWAALAQGDRVEISAPSAVRAKYLCAEYMEMIDNPQIVENAIERLAPFHSRCVLDTWRAKVAVKDFESLAAELIEAHYDPLYDRTRRRRKIQPITRITLSQLNDDAINQVAQDVLSRVIAPNTR